MTEGLSCIAITGKISIEPNPHPDVKTRWKTIIIMGPTGSGKSSFIEALGGKSQNLAISKDQLDGYTQTVTVYKVVNCLLYDLRFEAPRHVAIHLVDTPGFLDSKLSEREVVRKIYEWMSSGHTGIPITSSIWNKILYFIPINDTRLAGSKRRTIEMLISMFGQKTGASITFVTTMWDNLYTEEAVQRGEARFAELQDKHLKEYIAQGAKITRFTNTMHSALQVLNTQADGNAITTYYNSNALKGLTSSQHLYWSLYDRIENGLQVRKIMIADLLGAEAQTNLELRSILRRNLRENQETLDRYIEQFDEYVASDLPWGVDPNSRHVLRESIFKMQCAPIPTGSPTGNQVRPLTLITRPTKSHFGFLKKMYAVLGRTKVVLRGVKKK